MESIRQLQISKVIQQGLSEVLLKRGRDLYGAAFVTITQVKTTPDLALARVYLSVYNVPDKQAIVDLFTLNVTGIRTLLGRQIRNKVRRIPELEFYLDGILDEVSKVDALFDKLKQDKGVL